MLCYLRSLHTYTFAIHPRCIRLFLLRSDRKENPLYQLRTLGGMGGQATKKGSIGGGEARQQSVNVHLELRRRSLNTSHTTSHPTAPSQPHSPRVPPNRNTAPSRLPFSLLHLATQVQSSSDRNGQNPSLFPLEYAALDQRELGGKRDGKARIRRVSV